jgi:hypothetical protein
MTEIVDKAGRRITLRRVGVLETLRLFRALGGELAENKSYVGLATIAASADMIDDVPVPFPTSVATLEAIIERLGEDGMDAISDVWAAAQSGRTEIEAGN